MATQVKLLRNLSLIVVALVITLALPLSVIGEEVITLTTIMPSQDILKVKKGVVGENYKSTAVDDIGASDLYIEGNVGIGTTNPSAHLEVYSSSYAGVKIHADGTNAFLTLDSDTNSATIINFREAGLGKWDIQNDGDDNDKFLIRSSAANTRFVIDQTNGNVGIGTTSPGAKLHVGGTAGTDGIMFPDGTLQKTAGGGKFYDSGWFAISNGTYKDLTHNLGTTRMTISIYAAINSSGANMSTVTYAIREADSGKRLGGSVQTISSTTFTFYAGAHGYRKFTSAGGFVEPAWTWARVIALAQ